MSKHICIPNWVTREYLLANGVALVDYPTDLADMDGRTWLPPGNESSVVAPATFVDSIGGLRGGYGGVTFVWTLQNLSPMMTDYVHLTLFNRLYSRKFTVQNFNRGTGLWECYHVWGKWAKLNTDADPVAGGYSNLKITFIAGVAAPEE